MERDCDAPRDWSYRRNSTLRDWRIAFQTYSTTLANEHNTGHQTRTSPNSHSASTSWYSINRLRTSAGKMVQSKPRFCKRSVQPGKSALDWRHGRHRSIQLSKAHRDLHDLSHQTLLSTIRNVLSGPVHNKQEGKIWKFEKAQPECKGDKEVEKLKWMKWKKLVMIHWLKL